MDAPRHILSEGKGLDDFPVEKFYGKGIVVDAREKIQIDMELLEEYEKEIVESDFVLINTGWDIYWGDDRYYRGFPLFTKKSAEWLASKGIKGIGTDAVSVDPVDSTELISHNIFLKKEILILENLKSLELLHGHPFMFSCFPLKTVNSDGSPIRAVAFI
jgi:kynurenine formamidase